jgi:hypothetical protein
MADWRDRCDLPDKHHSSPQQIWLPAVKKDRFAQSFGRDFDSAGWAVEVVVHAIPRRFRWKNAWCQGLATIVVYHGTRMCQMGRLQFIERKSRHQDWLLPTKDSNANTLNTLTKICVFGLQRSKMEIAAPSCPDT